MPVHRVHKHIQETLGVVIAAWIYTACTGLHPVYLEGPAHWLERPRVIVLGHPDKVLVEQLGGVQVVGDVEPVLAHAAPENQVLEQPEYELVLVLGLLELAIVLVFFEQHCLSQFIS